MVPLEQVFSTTAPCSERYAMHVSADMTACPWKLNHGDHHVSYFYHCHTHTRFPRRRSNPTCKQDVPRRGHGSSGVAITTLPCLSFADRWDPHLGVPHVSERMVGLFTSGDPHPADGNQRRGGGRGMKAAIVWVRRPA